MAKSDKTPAEDTPQAGVTLSNPGDDKAQSPKEPLTTELPGGTVRTDY